MATLNNLTQENHSENITEIQKILDTISSDFRADASLNLLKDLESKLKIY